MNFFLLGQRIRKERLKHRYSQAELAEKLDISTNYMGQIERGDRKPSLDTLVRICNELGTNLDYLLSDSLTHDEDGLITDINICLNKLTHNELMMIYNIILAYDDLKKSEEKK